MKRAARLFSDEQRQQINAAVAEAEKVTSAEIIPAVTTASGRYDRAEDMVGLSLGIVGMVVVWMISHTAPATGNWQAVWTWRHGLWPIVAVMVLGFFAGAVLATVCPALRRLFIPGGQMRHEADGRAREVFYDSRVGCTAGGTGLLIFISLYEKHVVVLGDDAVVQQLSESEFDSIRDLVLTGMRTGHVCRGLCDAVAKAGAILADRLPVADGDVNELPNELVILD